MIHDILHQVVCSSMDRVRPTEVSTSVACFVSLSSWHDPAVPLSLQNLLVFV